MKSRFFATHLPGRSELKEKIPLPLMDQLALRPGW